MRFDLWRKEFCQNEKQNSFTAAVAEKYVMKLFLMLYKQQICWIDMVTYMPVGTG